MRPGITTLLMALVLTACTSSGPGRETGATLRPGSTSRTGDAVEPAAPARESVPCPAATQRELVGRRHLIVGNSFGWPKPFRSPSIPDRNNKILWRLQRPGRAADTADLLITASLNGSEMVVHRRVEGRRTPGPSRPSIIDMPEPGCWTFSLTWGAA